MSSFREAPLRRSIVQLLVVMSLLSVCQPTLGQPAADTVRESTVERLIREVRSSDYYSLRRAKGKMLSNTQLTTV